MRATKRILYALLTAALASGLLFALVPGATASGMAGGKTLSAGVGKDNRMPHPDYPLKLVFAARTGAYLAYVDVTITDSTGNQVVKTTADGPWLFVKLDPGTYTVQATRKGGATQSIKVTVPATGQRHVLMTWNVPEMG